MILRESAALCAVSDMVWALHTPRIATTHPPEPNMLKRVRTIDKYT